MNRIQKAEQFRRALQMLAMSLAEDKAAQVPGIYDPWVPGKAYASGEFVTYGGKLYKVLQGHTAQSDWTPDGAVSLFQAVGAAQ